MAATNNIPPPDGMQMSGNLCINWENFRAEFEDFSLATGLTDKSAEVQAATLRRVMGSDCRHVYKHNLNLSEEHQNDVKAILDALETYFKPAKNAPAQRLMSRRLKTSLPVASTLLHPSVVQGVPEMLQQRKQISKLGYDKCAKELPELAIGEPIRMKPLPGDRTGRWRLGSCVRKVAPRSYLVDVDGTLYRRNRVDLRVAERPILQDNVRHSAPGLIMEPAAPMTSQEFGRPQVVMPEEHGENGENMEHVNVPDGSPSLSPARVEQTPAQRCSPSAQQNPVYTRSGRQSRPPDRLNL